MAWLAGLDLNPLDPADPDDHGEPHAWPVYYRTGDIVSPYVQFNEPLLVQDCHFIDCIRTGRRPATPGERGLDIVRGLSATDVAESTGRPARGALSTDRAGSELVRGVAS